MFKIKDYLYTEIVPITMASLLFLFYKKVICNVAVSTNSESNFRFICEFKWKDGIFLLSSYCIVKLLSSILKFDTIFKRLLLTVLLYCFAYGIIAFPFLIASFFQPIEINVFVHVFILIVIIEVVFTRIFSRRTRQI